MPKSATKGIQKKTQDKQHPATPQPQRLPQSPREAVDMAGQYICKLLQDVPYAACLTLQAHYPEILRAEQAMEAAVLATNSTARVKTMASRYMHAWHKAVQAHRDPQAPQIALALGRQEAQATAPEVVDMQDSVQFTKQFLAKPVGEGVAV